MIDRDLAAARSAKTAADQAVTELNATIKQARSAAQAQIAAAVEKAKAEAALQAAALNAKLDEKLAESEAQIAAARPRRWRRSSPWRPGGAEHAAPVDWRGTRAGAAWPRVDDALAARKAA